jgi:KaiC/GvpD/RAD55 family RecA-like ATPase
MAKTNVVPTGIPGFDELIEGGFPRGSVITVAGPTGSGKSIFAMEYLYNGVTKFDEPGFYISFDERKRLIYKNLAKFGWNFPAYEAEKQFVFIEFPIHEASQFVTQENSLFNLIIELGIERVVIDPVTPLALLYETEQKRLQELMKLVNTLRSWGTTTLLVAEDETTRGFAGTEPLSDGVVKLYNTKKQNYRVRALEVIKMRGVSHTQKVCPIKFVKNGLEVYPNQFVFDD